MITDHVYSDEFKRDAVARVESWITPKSMEHLHTLPRSHEPDISHFLDRRAIECTSRSSLPQCVL